MAVNVCKQCGQPKPDNFWTICSACLEANAAYAKETERLAYSFRQEFARKPPSGVKAPELRRPSEQRGRKARYARALPYQQKDDDDDDD